MEWQPGKYPITSLTVNGVIYNLWVQKFMGDPATIWMLYFTQGDWQVASPINLWTILTDETKIPSDPNTTIGVLALAIQTQLVDLLNVYLINYFKGGSVVNPTPNPTPATVFEKVETILKALTLSLDVNGIPQVGNPLLVAIEQRITGYITQFGSIPAYADGIKTKEAQGQTFVDLEAASLFKLLHPELF